MLDHVVFMMGEYAARFPRNRQYARNHMWAQPHEGALRFGFTDYAVRLLQDVYFLDWSVAADSPVVERQEIGSIESKKAESTLYAPLTGRLTAFNEDLLYDPSAINTANYDAGWLFAIAGEPGPLLDVVQYVNHLEAVWETTKKVIQAQANA